MIPDSAKVAGIHYPSPVSRPATSPPRVRPTLRRPCRRSRVPRNAASPWKRAGSPGLPVRECATRPSSSPATACTAPDGGPGRRSVFRTPRPGRHSRPRSSAAGASSRSAAIDISGPMSSVPQTGGGRNGRPRDTDQPWHRAPNSTSRSIRCPIPRIRVRPRGPRKRLRPQDKLTVSAGVAAPAPQEFHAVTLSV